MSVVSIYLILAIFLIAQDSSFYFFLHSILGAPLRVGRTSNLFRCCARSMLSFSQFIFHQLRRFIDLSANQDRVIRGSQ